MMLGQSPASKNGQDVGDMVFVLCADKYSHSPSLMKTVITGLRITETSEALRFWAIDERDEIVKVFNIENEAEARSALAQAIEFHKTRRQRERQE